MKRDDDHKKILYPEPFHVFWRSRNEGRELWRDIMEDLYDAAELTQEVPGRETKWFRRIYLGFERIKYMRRIQKYEDKILVISGGADDIFPTRKLLDLGPDTGLALLQVPGVTHWVRHRSIERWRKWQQMVVDIMEAFHDARKQESS